MKDYGKCLQNWNRSISNMLHDCMHLGEQFCMPVHYESLVLDTEKWVRKIAQFLQVPFDSRMLKHYTLIGEEDGIHVSKYVLPSPLYSTSFHRYSSTQRVDFAF